MKGKYIEKIIEILQGNNRLTNKEIGVMIHLTGQACYMLIGHFLRSSKKFQNMVGIVWKLLRIKPHHLN
ncbi:AsnC family protein [Listeria seeligeri]|uniref:AsnC family protein n=1 Tax=Listeria seeligeri TaxID=1640 RepID=UPI00396F6946